MARAHAVAGAPAAASGVAAAAAANEVTIDNFAFNPKVITIKAGSKLTWRNRDDVPHKIQSTDNRFAGSPLMDTKAVYSVGFPESGEYPYFCSLHPVMTGKIVVTR
jgi:plastocyanin